MYVLLYFFSFFFLLFCFIFLWVFVVVVLTIHIGLEFVPKSRLLVIKVNEKSLVLISYIKPFLCTIPQGRVEIVLLTRLS